MCWSFLTCGKAGALIKDHPKKIKMMRKDNARKDSEVETLTTKGSQIKSSLLSEKGMEREFEESLKKKA